MKSAGRQLHTGTERTTANIDGGIYGKQKKLPPRTRVSGHGSTQAGMFVRNYPWVTAAN